MGVTGVGEVPIALQAWRSLRGAEELSYPAYVGYSVRCAPFHVIASEAKQSIVTSRAERWIASLRSQ